MSKREIERRVVPLFSLKGLKKFYNEATIGGWASDNKDERSLPPRIGRIGPGSEVYLRRGKKETVDNLQGVPATEKVVIIYSAFKDS